MKKLLILLLSALSLIAYAQTEVKKVAILETVDKMGNVPYGILFQVRSSLTFAISSHAGYEGYDRVDMTAITGEQSFQRTGMVSDEQIKRVGEMTGAAYVLIAEAALYDDQNIIIAAKILDVETGGVMSSTPPAVAPKDPTKMAEACIKCSQTLVGERLPTIINAHPIENQDNMKIHYNQTEMIYCDGEYKCCEYDDYSQLETLYHDCGNDFNIDNFEISFDYYLTNYKDMTMIVLGHFGRMLQLRITNNRIEVTTHNQDYSYMTNISVVRGNWQNIKIVYDHGNLSINNQLIRVHLLEHGYDNVLTSMNFSNGGAYNGWFKNILVKSIGY